MGLFDRFADKKPEPQPTPTAPEVTTGVMARLASAARLLDAKDLPGAMAIYEDVLAHSGDRPDVLVTISADLGVNGYVREIIELIAPHYDADRHGPATGLNLLQAYIALRNAEAAQHVLDILFTLKRADLQERLYGFSNAIAELIHADAVSGPATAAPGTPPEDTKVNLVSISKPIWFYGLEPLADQVLPPKDGRLRHVAFAQLATPGLPDVLAAAAKPEDELGRLSRALPLWLAETFYFSPHYAPAAVVGLVGSHYSLFGGEWTTDNLRQLVDTTNGPLDYIFTGAIRQVAGDYEMIIRVWEVKKFRERKQFLARWTPATADIELAKLHEQIRLFMEWSPGRIGLPYKAPVSPRAWLETLGASLSLFLGEKNLLSKEQILVPDAILARAAADAATGEAASLAFITLRNRAERLGVAARLDANLADSPLIAQAGQLPR